MERRPIQQLPTSLVNRIAAGEVIERPASVVKELVENAIDAGATQIIVEIEDGGRELIRVVDNGGGIPAAELPLAFAEHATSKIRTDDDLFAIGTMGFRGEALASIGSVAHARILSRTAGSEAAYEILNRGGSISDPQASPGNVGTTVEVRNLFFNVPARRKFLKGSATEAGHVSDTLLRLALPYPQVAFKLLSNGRVNLDMPATTPELRLLEAWPDSYREQRLPVDARDAEIVVRGIIGLPETASPTPKYQYLYLNGRHIRDRFIQHAMKEAYRGLTEPGRQPAAVLLITMPPGDVDVNVHPTKVEVRFKDSGRIHGLVLSRLRERLLGSDLAPTAAPRREMPGVPEAQRTELRQRLADFFKQSYGEPQQGSGFGVQGSAQTDAGAAALAPAPPPLSTQHSALSTSSPDEIAIPSLIPPMPPTPTMAPERIGAAPAVPAPTSLSAGPAMQLHNSYLVAETADGLLIIDQHALHERIIYEELLKRLDQGPLESQRLLIPDVIPASPRQIALLEQIQELLARLGIEAVPFGPGSVAVQAFPSFLHKLSPGDFVRDLLERGEQEALDLTREELLHEVLDMMSCKAAVKAGDPLTPAEIEALLARRELVDRASNCPHGRPTTLRLTLRDLEKQFKRTGF